VTLDIWLNAFLALFAIINPIGNVAIFADFTENLDRRTRITLFNVVIGAGYGTLVVMSLAGSWIMTAVFQINIDEFRIAGGIILTVLSVRYIVFPPPRPEIQADDSRSILQIGVVPMAVPLLVGPGSIVTGILILDRDGLVVTLGAITAVFAVAWVLFQLSPFINRFLGIAGRLILSRILWVFIGAIGVHFLTTGIRGVFLLGAG
jgi:multiple antibiotic resistance protein